MSNSLAGRRIIVTGAARGLGADILRGLAAAGARVVGMDQRDEAGNAVIKVLGEPAHYLHCDVSNKSQVQDAFAAAAQWLGGLDVLVQAAGLDRLGPSPEAIEESDWDLIFNVDAKGTFLCNQAAFHQMHSGGGAIINFGSMAGVRGMGDRAAYSAAKGAVMAWTRAAAQAWGPKGITVNAIAPIMATDVAERYIAQLDESARTAFKADLSARIPMGGQMGEPVRDLVPLMIFLAGDGARYITGQTFAVDGGMMMLGS